MTECSEEKIKALTHAKKADLTEAGVGVISALGGAASSNLPLIAIGAVATIQGLRDHTLHNAEMNDCNSGLPPKIKDTSQATTRER